MLDANYATIAGKTDTTKTLNFIPITVSGEFSPLPNLGILPYLKLAGGIVLESYVSTSGATAVSNIDAIFLGGAGAKINISKELLVKVEGTYNLILEASTSAALINVGASVGYNF